MNKIQFTDAETRQMNNIIQPPDLSPRTRRPRSLFLQLPERFPHLKQGTKFNTRRARAED